MRVLVVAAARPVTVLEGTHRPAPPPPTAGGVLAQAACAAQRHESAMRHAAGG